MVVGIEAVLDWLVEHVKYFRNMGFYKRFKHLSDKELAVTLRNSAKTRYEDEGFPFDRETGLLDPFVLNIDDENLWWEGGEMDIGRGDNVYVNTIQGWSRISRGYLVPEDLTEI